MRNEKGTNQSAGQEAKSRNGKLSIREMKRLYHETIKGKITMSVLALVIISLSLLGIITSVLNSHSRKRQPAYRQSGWNGKLHPIGILRKIWA